MDEQERLRVNNTNTGDPEVNVQAGQTRDINVQNAHASGNADVFQAGRDQYVETHLYFGVGVRRTRRVEADAGVEVDPYPRGMAALRPEDAEWFFGRDDLLEDLIERVDKRFREGGRPLMVMAPSGAGKSSLLHAGLIPKLEQGAIPGSQHWPGLQLTPTATPIKELAEAITVLTGEPAADVERELVERPDRCVEALGAVVRERSSTVIAANARLMVIVDQLEELFTLCTDDAERRRFLDVLSRLCAPGTAGREPVALVVFGMRADFYVHCAEYPELRESVRHGHVVVGPMRTEKLREAILYPAQRAGLRVEPGLVELLLSDLGALGTDDGKDARPGRYEAGRLPLLAHALRATYLGRHGRTLSVEKYRETGGIEKAVAKTANDTFKELDLAARKAAPRLFLRLIKIGDGTEHTRRRVPRTELLGDNTDQAVTAALDAFTSKRLLTQGLDDDTVEITHEALIYAWPRLRKWIDNDRAGNLVRQQLDEAATAWENEGHDRAALYRGARLATAREHTSTSPCNDNLTPAAQQFLEASTQHENHVARRRRRTLQGGWGLAALVGVLAVVLGVLLTVAQEERDNARFHQITAQADQLRIQNPSLAAQLDLAAHRIRPDDPEVNKKLLSTQHTPFAIPLPGISDASSVALSADGTLATISFARDGVSLWDVSDPAQLRRPNQLLPHEHDVLESRYMDSLSLSADGNILATTINSGGGGDGEVWLWDVSDPAQPRRVGESLPVSGGEGSVSLSADGTILATIASDGVWLWDVSDPAQPRRVGESLPVSGAVGSVSLSADGNTLATINTSSNDVWLWDVSDPAQPHRQGRQPLPDSRWVVSVSLSADGNTLATTINSPDGGDGVWLWDVSDPTQPGRLGESLPDSGGGDSVAFSADGNTLATGSSTRGGSDEVRLWNIPARLRIGSNGTNTDSAALSADGSTLATGVSTHGGTAKVWLWDVSDSTQPRRLGQPHSQDVYDSQWVDSVSLSADGTILATNSSSRGGSSEVRLWDVSDPVEPRRLGEPLLDSGRVGSVSLSADGTILATNSDVMLLWNEQQAISRICTAAKNNLGSDEWNQYIPGQPFTPPCKSP